MRESISSKVFWSVSRESSSPSRIIPSPHRPATNLAIQHGLGILSKRRNGPPLDRAADSSANATTGPLNGFMTSLKDCMPYRLLGRTGVRVSALGLGGSHIGSPKLSRAEAVRIIHAAIDGGLTFMDNSWDYHYGESEVRLGKALKSGYRYRAFVMTKVDGRTKIEAARQLDQSLRRLR